MKEFDKTVKHELDSGHYVTLEKNGAYHVWVPGVTYSTCDSAYQHISLAITRCTYLSKNNIKNLKPNTQQNK
jgi:hypothetical protein